MFRDLGNQVIHIISGVISFKSFFYILKHCQRQILVWTATLKLWIFMYLFN